MSPPGPGGKKGVATELFRLKEQSGQGPGPADETPVILSSEPPMSGGTTLIPGSFHADLNTNDVDPTLDVSLGEMPVGSSGFAVAAITVHMDDGERVIRYGRSCSVNRLPGNRVALAYPGDSTWVLAGDRAYLCEWKTRGTLVR